MNITSSRKFDSGLGREENEDLAWPGFLSTSMRGYQSSPEAEYPVIRNEDFENHNKDGGLWVIMRGKVKKQKARRTLIRPTRF